MELVPLHKDFGAEVRGVDLMDVICSADAYEQVRAAFEERSVLVWRDQQITDDVQATFARTFGPLEKTKVASGGAGTIYARVGNLDLNGNVVPPSDKLMLIAKANQLWHTDSSFKQVPALASILSARVIPQDGGGTEFVSMRAAWESLDLEEQLYLQDLDVAHSYATSRAKIDQNLMGVEERAALPPVLWQMTWENPTNGRKALYLASHSGGIAGMEDEEACKLIDRLVQLATEPDRRYVHLWRPGDVILWDNRATMHRGQPWKGGQGRAIVRVTVSATENDGLALVRPRKGQAGKSLESQASFAPRL